MSTQMTYDEALRYIHSAARYPHGNDPGRMKKLLGAVGDPHKKLNYVHIAGTDGKGSVTAMTASVLQEAGYKTGRFVSPYILEFRERIEVNGEMIPKEVLAELVGEIQTAVEELRAEGRAPAEFEIVTTLALLYYSRVNCDIVCLEVGLGGRFDSTNAIESALVSVIMAIGYDHTEILGPTLGDIAGEKAGILKPGGTLVLYPGQAPEAGEVILREAEGKDNAVYIPDMSRVEVLSTDPLRQVIRVDGMTVEIPFAGEYQIANTMVVLTVLERLREKGFQITDRQITEGIGKTSFPARMEVLGRRPLVILDGAHNPHGAEALATALKTLRKNHQPVTAVVGMLGYKDFRHSLEKVLPLCDHVVAVSPNYPRALPAEELCEAAKEFCSDCRAIHDFNEALSTAEALTGPEGLVMMFGSLYLAGDLRPLALKRWQEH